MNYLDRVGKKKEEDGRAILELIRRESGIGFWEVVERLGWEVGFVEEECRELVRRGEVYVVKVGEG